MNELYEREVDLSELAQDHEKGYSEAIAMRGKLNRLRENSDFKWLTAVMQSNLDTRVQNCFRETTSFDQMIANNSAMAEIRGFQAAMLFAQSLLNGAEQAIKLHEPFIEKDEE